MQKIDFPVMAIDDFIKLNQYKETYALTVRYAWEEDKPYFKEELEKMAKIDLELFRDRIAAFYKRKTELNRPLVGEWLKTVTGKYTRFTHAWDKGIQTGGGQGSYFIFPSGSMSYSGGLDYEVPYEFIEPTDETHPGECWIFHLGHTGAHRGVDYSHPFPVYRLKPLTSIDDFVKIKWSVDAAEVTEEVYNYALNVLPPIGWSNHFFAMGEIDRHIDGKPVYYCFNKIKGKYYATLRTIDEAKIVFQKVN